MGVRGRPGRREWEITDAGLDHVALVTISAAMVGPITVIPGFDVRSATTRPKGCGWGLRAIVEAAHAHRHEPRVVHGQTATDWTELRHSTPPELPPIEHSIGGRVLSVR